MTGVARARPRAWVAVLGESEERRGNAVSLCYMEGLSWPSSAYPYPSPASPSSGLATPSTTTTLLRQGRAWFSRRSSAAPLSDWRATSLLRAIRAQTRAGGTTSGTRRSFLSLHQTWIASEVATEDGRCTWGGRRTHPGSFRADRAETSPERHFLCWVVSGPG